MVLTFKAPVMLTQADHSSTSVLAERCGWTTRRPANVPQRHANQARHARYAAHARRCFLSDFVSIENIGSKIQLPKLKVPSSSLVARSKFSLASLGRILNFSNARKRSRKISSS